MLIKTIKRFIKIAGFKGYVAHKDLAKSIIAPPYDTLDSSEARILAHKNPMSFLRVNKPEIDLEPDLDPYSSLVYQKGLKNIQEFIRNRWIIKDDEARVYIYALTMENRRQIGIISASSVDDYANGHIKKHEKTRAKKEKDRTELTETQNANEGPVFLTYKADISVENILSAIVAKSSSIDVTTDDHIRHELWKCDADETNQIIKEFKKIENVYIADGHHRAASAYNVAKRRKEIAISQGKIITGNEDFNYFLTISFPTSQVKILDYNRVVKDLNNKTDEEFLSGLAENFEIFGLSEPKPTEKHMFSMFFRGEWKGLKIKSLIDENNPIERLDCQLLTRLCLDPILGIKDITIDERIDFVGGIRGLEELERRCKLDSVLAFALRPVSIEDVISVADAGLIMPPKSTWFEPKPRSGLVVRVFED